MQTVAIINQKGGSGKTTTTVNLAAALAELGLRILVIDLDPQASTTMWMHPQETDGTVHDLLSGAAPMADLIHRTSTPRIDLLPGSSMLANAERAYANEQGAETLLRRKMRKVRNDEYYDHVLIDCPPNLGLLSVNALSAAQGVVIPVEAHAMAFNGAANIAHSVEVIRDRVNEDLAILGLLVCRLDKRTAHCLEVEAALRKQFGRRVFRTVIRENIKLAEAPSFAQTILQYDKSSYGAEDHRDLALELRRRAKRMARAAAKAKAEAEAEALS